MYIYIRRTRCSIFQSKNHNTEKGDQWSESAQRNLRSNTAATCFSKYMGWKLKLSTYIFALVLWKSNCQNCQICPPWLKISVFPNASQKPPTPNISHLLASTTSSKFSLCWIQNRTPLGVLWIYCWWLKSGRNRLRLVVELPLFYRVSAPYSLKKSF